MNRAPDRFRPKLSDNDVQKLKGVFFSEENIFRERYRCSVENRSFEIAHWMRLILANKPTPAAVFYFLRWLADDDWFASTMDLYRNAGRWQSRLLCIGSASRWARDHENAYRLVLEGLRDKSIEVVCSAIRGCAYSLRHDAIPHLAELKIRLTGLRGARHREAKALIENTLVAIETGNHHCYLGDSPRTGLIMWPWDETNISGAELDLNWILRVLHRCLGERLKELGSETLPEFVGVKIT